MLAGAALALECVSAAQSEPDFATLVARAVEAERRAPESDEARALWQAVLAVQPEHAAAHRALGHRQHEGAWYPSYAALASAIRAEERARLETAGEVRFGAGWVPWHDEPYLRMGWVRDARGRWLPPEAEPELLGPGSLRVTDGRLALHTTLARSDAMRALQGSARVLDDLQRLFGVEAFEPVELVLVDSLAAYNALAAGDPTSGTAPTEITGASAYHYAYFADGWFTPPRNGQPGSLATFRGTGVAYWDLADERLEAFGPFAARHAAALAWLDSIDPSPAAIADATLAGAGGVDQRAYWAEKRLPRWLHVGAAMYAERFFVDHAPGVADPLWVRRWAHENLARSGGATLALDEVFHCDLDPLQPELANRTMQRAGLVVAFLADGTEPEVEAARQVLVGHLRALDQTRDPVAKRRHDAAVRNAARDLERALRAKEASLAAFGR
jgi:hypothetical protein